MAKDKERTLNPAAAQRKADKTKALKKSKAAVTQQRNERLAHRNPERLQRQIDELKEVESAGGSLKPREKQNLEQLERDVKAIRKAREALGDRAPLFSKRPNDATGSRRDDAQRGGRPSSGAGGREREPGILGKRRRDGEHVDHSSSSDTDPDVRSIPMPKDTPPPVPRRRPQHQSKKPVPHGEENDSRTPHALPAKPVAPVSQKTYSAAPAMRNLQKEATSKFMPATVARKVAGMKGQGQLLEPEEMEKLEAEGYGKSNASSGTASAAKADAAEDERRLAEEARRFDEEMKDVAAQSGQGEIDSFRSVQMEDVEDEDLRG